MYRLNDFYALYRNNDNTYQTLNDGELFLSFPKKNHKFKKIFPKVLTNLKKSVIIFIKYYIKKWKQ